MRVASSWPTGLPGALALLLTVSASCGGGGGTNGPDCAPTTEICNGLDDDCDGLVDEGFGVGDVCSTGVGACAALGQIVCGIDQLGTECNAVAGSPSAEACNGLDDDCDGTVDQGDPGGGGACATGLTGVCGAGTLHCAGGVLQCVQSVAASGEACNGLDDDCDGAVDQGDPGGGGACATGLAGVCDAGTLHCAGGVLQCVQSVAASGEACNGLDDDCDGAVDQGDPGGGGACATGLAGVCGAGTLHCAGGVLQCVQSVAASAESCNGLDDDCDGAVDEGCRYSHTIVIDGYNDFVAATERIGTTSPGYDAWVTWDSTHLYVGYSGTDIAASDSHKWMLLYFDFLSGSAGLPVGVTYNTQALVFPAGFTGDFEMALRSDGWDYAHRVDAGAWVSLGNTTVADNYYRRIYYCEMQIPFVALGDPVTFGMTIVLVNDTVGQEWTYGGLYPDAFTDGYNPAVQHYLLVDRTASAAPNAPQNKH